MSAEPRSTVRPQDPAAPAAPAAVDGVPATADGAPWRAVAVLAEVAGLPLAARDDLRAVLRRASTLVRTAFPRAAAVSITVGPPESPELQATESAFAQAVDGAQMRAGEGPCASAYAARAPVHSADVPRDLRWRRLAPSAAAVGLGASVAAPVRGPQGVIGVLNVFATAPGALRPGDAELAAALGDAVGAVVATVRERAALEELTEQLRTALGSRATIEQAKGIVMAHTGEGPEEAFSRLSAASQHRNVKLRVLAGRLVADPAQVADVLRPPR